MSNIRIFSEAIVVLGSATSATPDATNHDVLSIGMGICMGIAALGAALGQGRVGASALEGVCRNPNAAGKALVPLVLTLAFIETLVLFAFVIASNIDAHFG